MLALPPKKSSKVPQPGRIQTGKTTAPWKLTLSSATVIQPCPDDALMELSPSGPVPVSATPSGRSSLTQEISADASTWIETDEPKVGLLLDAPAPTMVSMGAATSASAALLWPRRWRGGVPFLAFTTGDCAEHAITAAEVTASLIIVIINDGAGRGAVRSCMAAAPMAVVAVVTVTRRLTGGAYSESLSQAPSSMAHTPPSPPLPLPSLQCSDN